MCNKENAPLNERLNYTAHTFREGLGQGFPAVIEFKELVY